MLREEPAHICALLTSVNPNTAAVLGQLAAANDWHAHERYELDLPSIAMGARVPVVDVDSMLLMLSGMDLVLYRPFRKAIRVMPTKGLGSTEASQLLHLIKDPRAAMQRKLEEMERYATIGGRGSRAPNGAPACRRSMILEYFGESFDEHRCGACDLCCPDQPYPWSSVTSRDVAGVADFFDPAFTVLETVHWNEERGQRGSSVFGMTTLRNALLGNGWQLTRYEQDPNRRKARLAALHRCPFWGVFEAMDQNEARLNAVINRLTDEGYLVDQEIMRSGAETYRAPALTNKAIARLQSGETLGW